MTRLVEAATAVGRLDGITRTLPNPDLFVAMYVRREAVLSSQIEGTQSTLDDVLAFELDAASGGLPQDVDEIVNYVAAMNQGLARLESLPLSSRLLREIHATLLSSGRGATKLPGEFRTSQNWIGHGGGLRDAVYVPPPPHEMRVAISDLEQFLHSDHGLPPLIEAALAHAQFETIHPFLDDNGRVGRLLVTLLLVHRGVIARPTLSLSHYLNEHREQYYDLLQQVRDEGAWEAWVEFFLTAVRDTAEEGAATATSLQRMRDEHFEVVRTNVSSPHGPRLLDLLFRRPLVDVNLVAGELGVTYATANRMVGEVEEQGILREVTGQRRNRVYRYDEFLERLG